MGARGPLPKPDAVGHRKRADLVVVDGTPARVIPAAPRGLLPASRRLWAEFWGSGVASAVDQHSDLGRLNRWILAVDEIARVGPVFRKVRLVRGSTGQTVLNPLAGYLSQLEATVASAEQEFGMTPKARARLGLTIGQAKLTAAELNNLLEHSPRAVDPDAEPEEWEADFTDA